MASRKDDKSEYPGTTTNREVFGTWNRPLDFTITMIGYTVGIHDFWRFPYLCYKFGGVFLIPFSILTIIVGIPTVFMEFTIGQYRGIGATEVFGVMAPILTGVGYLLAWNSLTTCWIFTMMISWSRLYSNDATSCAQGWGGCSNTSYYNTKACYNGRLDEDCQRNASMEVIYYNFECMKVVDFCVEFNATSGPQGKYCIDGTTGENFSIYTRRLHSSVEYYYGGICGLKRANSTNETYNQPVSQDLLEVDPASTAESEISLYSFTTFCILCFFLYEDLLSVSVITYILNVTPFFALMYFMFRGYTFHHASRGITEFVESIFTYETLLSPDIWVEAVIQILSTSGIGNGVLINLSTFNNFKYHYVSDGFLAAVLNMFCSIGAALICFCTIGHYLDHYNIGIPFYDFIVSKSSHSSLEFGYIVYTQFINLVITEHYTIILFFFMITSFSTDSALRLVQNLLDAMVAIFVRLRSHRFATLVGICLFGYVAILPMTRNGGTILFMEYEYFLLKFVWPFIVLIQVGGVTWVYKTRRILNDAEEMGLKLNSVFRWYITICLQFLTVGLLFFVLVYNVITHQTKRFNNVETVVYNEIFGWVFVLTPVVLLLLSIIEQLIATKRSDWSSLFRVIGEDEGGRNARLSGVSASKYGPVGVHPQGLVVHKILAKWQRNIQGGSGIIDGIPKNQDQNQISSNTEVYTREQLTEKAAEEEVKAVARRRHSSARSLLKKRSAFAKHLRALRDYFETWPGRFDESDEEKEQD